MEAGDVLRHDQWMIHDTFDCLRVIKDAASSINISHSHDEKIRDFLVRC